MSRFFNCAKFFIKISLKIGSQTKNCYSSLIKIHIRISKRKSLLSFSQKIFKK